MQTTTRTVLTKRGKRVRNFFIAIVVLYILYKMFDMTTPQQCKVPIDDMSQWCKDLLYPHSQPATKKKIADQSTIN